MKILVFDAKKYDETTFLQANDKSNYEFVFRASRLTLAKAAEAKGFIGICTFVNCDVSGKVLKKLASYGVKFIFQRSAGYDNIDLKMAQKLDIKVYRVPSYSPNAVAEHAITLLLAINRNIHIAYLRSIQKNFTLNGLQGDTINKQIIGVMGAGRIGQVFIKIAKGFGAQVLVFDQFAQAKFPQLAKKLGFKFVDKQTLFKQSDYISLHLPLLENTKHIVNKETLSLVKSNVIIINTSRGALINTKDLLAFLDAGKVRGAGLDVYENEKGIFFFDHSNDLIPDPLLNRLRAHRNVIITSHQAFFTNLALQEIAQTTIKNIDMAINNRETTTRLIMQDDNTIING